MMTLFLSDSMKLFIISCFTVSAILFFFAADTMAYKYIDFSSDRSTWFFRIRGGENNVAFFDFFSPFDPTVKPGVYDPLVMCRLGSPYHMSKSGSLMINLEDLKKLYAPYFDFKVNEKNLWLNHTAYDKLVVSGFGKRATVIEYTRKDWELTIDISDNSLKNTGVLAYSQFMPAFGGRNQPPIKDTPVNIGKSIKAKSFTFGNSAVERIGGNWYVPLEEVMALMGKKVFKKKGYLHVQSKNMADVTVDAKRTDVSSPKVVVPDAANSWRGQDADEFKPGYTWADYMNDVADGKRKSGWLWRGFYIPSGNHFLDADGNRLALEANRIVPYNMYVPPGYDKTKTRMLFVLHGGTGNENTQTYRILRRNIPIDEYARRYNYILVSPNGWTQNPMWRENQAFYSFKKAAKAAMTEFPVDPGKVFITGNSMGGKGAMEVAMRLPDMFRAMAPTAVKILNRNRQTGKVWVNIEGTRYDLRDIKDIPALFVQGTADSVTSYKTQIGNKQAPGAMVKAIMPKLNNATYVAVEQGSHTYAFGSVLEIIFDFFEKSISSDDDNAGFKKISLKGNSAKVFLDGREYELSSPTMVRENTIMISLDGLKQMYGDDFKVYAVNSYNRSPDKAVNYLTIVCNHKTINFAPGQSVYRVNMKRYREDINIVSKKKRSGEKPSKKENPDSLDRAPRFSTAPFTAIGEIFVPALETIAALGNEAAVY